MAVEQLPDGRWRVYYRVRSESGKSRLKREYCGRGPAGEARAYARDAELGLLRRRPRNETFGPSFLELAKEYRDKRGLNDNSRKQLGVRLQAHLVPAFGAMPAIKIKPADVDRYVERRRSAGVSDATICRELTDLKAILNWSARRDPPLIPFNPIANFRKPSIRNAIARPTTEAEALRILKHALPHVRRAILIGWHLGLRPQGELLALRWSDVNWETGRILIMSAHKGGPQAREVPIHPDLLPNLKAWHTEDRKNGRTNIVHYHGRRVRSIGKAWRSAVAAAKIGRAVRPYDLRHHFVTRAIEEGADLKALSEIVGSAPQTLIKFYQHVTTRQHEKTVALIKPLAEGRKAQKKRIGS
jgi:integrase